MANAAERRSPPPRKPRAERQPDSESREKREQGPHDVVTVSLASPEHEWSNGDVAVGSPERVKHDLTNPPELRGSGNPVVDKAALMEKLSKEAKYVDAVRKNGFFAVADGVSGRKNGGDALASRFFAAETSEVLAAAGDAKGREANWEVLEKAALQAHDAIKAYKKDRPELKEMAAAVIMGRVTDDGMGGTEYPYIHMGDVELIVANRDTGAAHAETRPDSGADLMLEKGIIDEATYMKLMVAKSAQELMTPDMVPAAKAKMELIFKMRDAVANGVGSTDQYKPKRGVVTGLKKGDVIVQVSDGVTKNLTTEQIGKMIAEGASATDIAIAASKGESPDDVTVQFIEIGANEKEAGELDIDVEVETNDDLTPDERQQHAELNKSLEERRNYLKGLKDLQVNRGATVEREKIIMEQRRQLIDELRQDYHMRSRALAELQREAGVNEAEAGDKLDSVRRSSEWQQNVFDAAVAYEDGDFDTLRKMRDTEEGAMAANFVEAELNSGRETAESIRDSAYEELERGRQSVEKLGKLAFEHQKMAEITQELRALERERDAARAADDKAQMDAARRLLDEAAADAAEGKASESKRATPPPRKKRNWIKTGNE